ncbi:armadillo-like helical domain-containing protein 3 [Nilaparvata lugens]|uniref:armadillo-like helical domain-containing protein 3 n=1 Tax=Nilaparvata lugens TaxID=108931 RepID=UPI00193C9DA8|nr:armadillo-like helical domain-containing protein 3 [Nilaparvata lugens]XP_039282558.1 armadillo-like helical domain-containing protein 3 [Nilaparvata lugens]XP_039282559.1 armadillo-like helical domain-containing protein 3 [Nilaparvata lugens]
MISRKRSDSGSKRPLKEKVVQIYESFFKGEDLAARNPNFWDELFLLKPKPQQLEAEIMKLQGDQLLAIKDNMNMLFSQCIETLGHEHTIRVIYALQTLCAVVSSFYKKALGDCGFNVINILVGFDEAEERMRTLLYHCNNFLSGDNPVSLKSLCLKLLLLIVTGTENVSQNTLLEYIMMNSIFETLIQLLTDGVSRANHGHDVVLLLTLLVNYRKHEAANPYIVKLSILDDQLALNGYGQVITASLAEFCHQFTLQQTEPQAGSWLFSSISNIVGSMFVSEESGIRTQQMRAKNGVLVALYEAVHLNRNFVTTLAQDHPASSANSSSPPDPPSDPSTTPTTTTTPPPPPPPSFITLTNEPSNLLVTFFQYCSIVMQDTKCEASMNTVKLCFVILRCIAEDQYANSLMHDVNLTFRVALHHMPMRMRPLPAKGTSDKPSQPLASTLIELLVEFIMSHMMRRLPLEQYLQCVGCLHRLLCYQKRTRVRLLYPWKELWAALITLLKFILTNEAHLVKKMNIFMLSLQVVNIFNLFITYGDTFLPSPSSYDELYYEIIRMHTVFDNIYSVAFRYSTIEGEYKDTALRLTNSLINVRAIISHFTPKIDAWLANQGLSTPSESEILEVVRQNYDSLTLKLQDSLDQYERYSEYPRHASFFTAMVRSVVNDTRQSIDFTTLDLQSVLQEFSIIT